MAEDAIERTRAASFEDVLEAVPGVYVRARGTGEEPQISIRGSGLRNNFHTRGVNVLIDGFPFQNADGFSDVESFEFLAARRVEVYKGANSLRFGGNALGGAINIVTQTGRDAAPVRLRSEGGAFGFWKSYGSGAYDAGPWDAFLALSHTQQDGYRDHAEQDRQRAYGSLGRALRRRRFAARRPERGAQPPGAAGRARLWRVSRRPEEANTASELQDERRDFELGRGAVTLAFPVSDELRVDWQSQTSFQELDHPLAFGIIDNETWNAGTELRPVSEHPLLSLDSRFDAGVQLAYTRQPADDLREPGRPPRRELRPPARSGRQRRALLQRRPRSLRRASRWSAARAGSSRGGTCADEVRVKESDSVEYWFAAPSLGAIWRAVPGAELYANAGYAFEPGVLFELTAPGNATPGSISRRSTRSARGSSRSVRAAASASASRSTSPCSTWSCATRSAT